MKLVFVPGQNDFDVRFAGKSLGILSNRHFEAARALAIEFNRRVNAGCSDASGAIQHARQAMKPYLLSN